MESQKVGRIEAGGRVSNRRPSEESRTKGSYKVADTRKRSRTGYLAPLDAAGRRGPSIRVDAEPLGVRRCGALRCRNAAESMTARIGAVSKFNESN